MTSVPTVNARARREARRLRAMRVLRRLAEGFTIPEIGAMLEMSPASIDRYLAIAREELGTKTNAHAVAVAVRLRIIP